MGGESLDDGVPALLERFNALSKFVVLLLACVFPVLLLLRRLAALRVVTGPEETVLLLELCYTLLELAIVCLSAVAGVLGGDAVAVGARLLSLLRGDFRAWPFAWGAFAFW